MTRDWNDLLNDVHAIAPQVADAEEIAALVESFGYNDRSVRQFGFASVFALAEHMYLNFPTGALTKKIYGARQVVIHLGRDWFRGAQAERQLGLFDPLDGFIGCGIRASACTSG